MIMMLITDSISKTWSYTNCIFFQVFESDDPLDSKDFNPVDYINAVFPTEQVTIVIVKLLYNNFTWLILRWPLQGPLLHDESEVT